MSDEREIGLLFPSYLTGGKQMKLLRTIRCVDGVEVNRTIDVAINTAHIMHIEPTGAKRDTCFVTLSNGMVLKIAEAFNDLLRAFRAEHGFVDD